MRLYAAVLVLAVGALPSGGQSLRLRSDNDAYRFWIPTAVRTDQEYSSGLHLQQERPGAHGWGRLLGAIEPCGAAWGSRCAMTTVGFGQKIFTPRIDSTAWVSGQRPYAGWLYVEGSAAVATARMHRAAGVELGVTGGPSAAAWVQTRVHDLLGMWHPQGWVDQVPFEPALTVRYDEQRLFSRGGSRLSVQLIPGAGASLGSVRTEARAGMRPRRPATP